MKPDPNTLEWWKARRDEVCAELRDAEQREEKLRAIVDELLKMLSGAQQHAVVRHYRKRLDEAAEEGDEI